ncbi:hypothetical protein DFJ73DRAFT_110370 [Zopfochytrium polystomum]|nr:hypothetical protein DFJ73DRAFT_110370 [Zopfochytrium polystomum]
MAILARLSMVVIVSTITCASGLISLSLIESTLRDRKSSRPPDSPSLYFLASAFFTQCLSYATFLALLDSRDLGSRRFTERLGLIGLGWVSFIACCIVLVGSATHRTAIIVVSPFLRACGLAIVQSLLNSSGTGLGMRKLLESACYSVVDAVISAASSWIVASLFSTSDLSEVTHTSAVVISLPIVITMLALEQLAYWHVAKSFERSRIGEKSLLETVSTAVIASMSSVAIRDDSQHAAATITALHSIFPAMLVSAFAVVTALRASADNDSGFYLVVAGLLLFEPVQNLLILLWVLFKARRDTTLPMMQRTMRLLSDRHQPYIVLNHRLAIHCSDVSALVAVVFFFVPDTPLQQLSDACMLRFAPLTIRRVLERSAIVAVGEFLVDAGYYCFYGWVRAWRDAGRRGRVQDMVSISSPDSIEAADAGEINVVSSDEGKMFVWFLVACCLGLSSCVSTSAGVSYIKGLFGGQECNMIGGG